MKKHIGALLATLVAAAVWAAAAGAANGQPIYMPNAKNMQTPALQPPPVCCVPVGPPVAGEPTPVNMAYFGGHVQVTPKIYLVLWGWGQPGAFDHTTPGMPASDPDGAGARMLAFIKALGGSHWAGIQNQYYMTNPDGSQTFMQNPRNQFGGVWYDNTNSIVAAHNDAGGLT